ncbi:hypothetical protein BDW42DRAFT_182290 [Aspergillus taichungensis]|uniref:Uncharacterized protein n=1 Tax=Aspergillus taichungensis TaxID=482145 RepID=A0A2J5IA30_9EURO|nr:hypothetical protein BDW42DRAFT_182290 [Aspergillus taichungensis]
MKFLFVTSLLFSAATAWPHQMPPQQTDYPSRVQERDQAMVAAIVPTTTGQIGVNPVLVDPVETAGPYNTFISDYWKAKDKEQITQVQVTTKEGKPTTKTVTAPVAIMTGADGELNVLMTPKLQQKLAAMMKSVPACGKKRAEACGIERFLIEFEADDSKLIQSLKNAVEGIRFLNDDVLRALSTSGGAQEAKLVAGGVGAMGFVWTGARLFLNDQDVPLSYKIRDPPKNDIPKTEAPKKEESHECPKDAPKGKDAPLCPDCSGKDNTCQEGKYKNCHCLDVVSPIYYTYDQKWLTVQADTIKYALEHADEEEKPKVVCSDHGYDKAVAVDVSFIKSLADKFCDGDAKKDRHMTLSGKDISTKAYRKYTFDLTYAPPESDEKCFTDCAGAIGAMAATCQGLNSHTVQKGANATLDCGAQYSYEINIPDKPDDADITCANGGDYSKATELDVKFFMRMAENFCASDMSQSPSKDLTSDDIKSDKYKGYKFHFEGSNSPGCKPDCKATFERIAPKCQGLDSHSIQPSGNADFGCGSSYSYKIKPPSESPPETPPHNKLGELHCHGADDFGDHADIDPDWQNQYTGWACGGSARKESIMDENSDPVVSQTMTNNAPYYYSISWIKGCRGEKQSPYAPLGDYKFPGSKDQVTCMNLMRRNWKECINGGVGGWRDAGCLRYEFKAEYTK